ncbi:Uncharacterised protein [Escherichia coli]|nr:Uncharacterised protein [Escherichia coli]
MPLLWEEFIITWNYCQILLPHSRCVDIEWDEFLRGIYGASMGQKRHVWGILGHDWDVITHMNFTEFHMWHGFN